MKDLIRIRQQIISPIIVLNGNSLEELLDNGTCIINTLYGRYISPRTNSSKMYILKMFIEIPTQCLNIDIGKHKDRLFYFSQIYRYDIERFLENDPELRVRYNNAHARHMTSGSLKAQKEINLIYNIAAFKLTIRNFLLSQAHAVTNISKYKQNINLSYSDLYITKNSFNNKESYKNAFNSSTIYDVSIKNVNIKKIDKLIKKLNRLNYLKNE